MFDKEDFIEACLVAVKEHAPRRAVEELVARAVSVPAQIIRGLGEPRRAGIDVIYRAADLTILNVLWGPGLAFHPHDHRMWAVIGIYAGREDNFFFRRNGKSLERHGMKQLNERNTIRLGDAIIHAVTNPLEQITAAIHVYGGDLWGTPRSEWDAQTLSERPYDTAATLQIFEESNARFARQA